MISNNFEKNIHADEVYSIPLILFLILIAYYVGVTNSFGVIQIVGQRRMKTGADKGTVAVNRTKQQLYCGISAGNELMNNVEEISSIFEEKQRASRVEWAEINWER